jgi:hypothetical protein
VTDATQTPAVPPAAAPRAPRVEAARDSRVLHAVMGPGVGLHRR